MFRNFSLASLKKMKPRNDNSFDTMQEIKELTKIPINKKFVKDHDDIEAIFFKTAKNNNIDDYDAKLVNDLVKESAPIILKLKEHFNRPRPKKLAKKMNIKNGRHRNGFHENAFLPFRPFCARYINS